MWIINQANSGLILPHIDNDRPVTINIPISVDLNNSCFFISREEPDENIIETNLKYEPEKYDWYNVEKSVLSNALAPHGYFNHANSLRVLLSVKVEGSYKNALDNLPTSVYT